jgi:Fascin domain
VSATAASPGPSERYTAIRQPAGVLLLKSVHGKYLTAEPDGRLTANRVQPGAPQTFKMQ